MTKDLWTKVSLLALPPASKFLLVYVEFASISNPGATPQILKAWYDGEQDCWRNAYGRVTGEVTHYMPLPDAPRD